jgi:hypothetical protein
MPTIQVLLLHLWLMFWPQYVPTPFTHGQLATVTCGYTATGNVSTNALSAYLLFTSCTTGSDSNGYSLVSVYFYSGTAAAGTWYGAVYNNSSSLPSTLVCGDSTHGVAAVSSATWFSDPVANFTSCSTLSANTVYWVAEHNSNSSNYLNYLSTGCSTGGSAADSTDTAWTTPLTAASASSVCFTVYMVLQPL